MRLNVQTLEDALTWDQPPEYYLLPNLIQEDKNLLVNVGPNVDARIFGMIGTYSVAGGKLFEPFGIGVGAPVLYCSGAGNRIADERRFQLISIRDSKEVSQKRAGKNFQMYHRDFEGDGLIFLDTHSDQEMFLESISRDLRLVVIDDIFAWVKGGRASDCFENGELAAFLRRLNERGIAVMAFMSGNKKSAMSDDLPALGAFHNVISLTYDSGAPREFGGGFNVHRRKIHEEESVPTSFSFWHTVVNCKLDFGWECRDQTDKNSVKNIELVERRMKVEQLLADGMNQKAIAALLDVDPATVSRDVAKLKEGAPEAKVGDKEGEGCELL
jgi:hypothetical protein